MVGPSKLYEFRFDPRGQIYSPSFQRANVGKFLNFSIQADGNFAININGTAALVPQLAQVSAIITGLLGIFGLETQNPEPAPILKTITIDPGVTLATLFGASQGVNILVQILKGKIQAIKNYVDSAVTSIKNLIECVLKNPLLAAALLAKIIRQGWIPFPEPVKKALIAARDAINKILGLNLIIYNPLAEYIKRLVEYLKFKFPPPILLPFIPVVPGCSPAFYSGRPPLSLLNQPEIETQVQPQTITVPGGFTSQININVPTFTLDVGPGGNPDLALTDDQVQNLLGGYNPYDLFTSGVTPVELDSSLNVVNFPLESGNNSATRQVQDRLISASNKVVNDITVLNKDISRAGFIPRTSPLDDLLCAPGESAR